MEEDFRSGEGVKVEVLHVMLEIIGIKNESTRVIFAKKSC